MRKGHARKRQLFVCRFIDFGGEAVRAANNKNQPFVYGVHLALHIVCELYGAHFFSALIQQHHHIARLERFQYQFALFFFLYVRGEAFGIFQFRDNFHIEREIASRALYVIIDGCNKVLFYGSSYDEQGLFSYELLIFVQK